MPLALHKDFEDTADIDLKRYFEKLPLYTDLII